MDHFFQELKKRGVVRVAGLYGAVVWLLLQASDVLFPAFEIPDSAVKILLGGSIVCLPIVLALAWFYEITDKGVQLESELQKSGAVRLMSGNEIYFVMITLLAIALSISIYLNVQMSDTTPQDKPKLISILISDFDNQTRDPVFDGSVESALTIGMEDASFITSYNRDKALKVASMLNAGTGLSEDRARLVAVREGISLVLSGSIALNGNNFVLKLKAIDPRPPGRIVAEAEAEAESKLEVLQAVGSLAGQLREAFGDATLDNDSLSASETFTASSLEAMQYYSRAQRQAHSGNLEEAIKLYEQATQEDSGFGRAFSGWALSEFQLGHREKAEQLWETTLTLLQGMTEREKYRTLGLYYTRVSRNYEKAIENYEALVKQFPGDAVGHSNLAVSYFMRRQFQDSLQAGRAIVELHPEETTFRSNYALYAMYAGDFETARQQAEKLTESEDVYYKALLPLSIANLAENETEAAKRSYLEMAELGTRGASLSVSGLADIALTTGNYDQAVEILQSGIEQDQASNSNYYLASKYITLAEAQYWLGDRKSALESIDEALATSQAVAQQVAAALLLVELGQTERAGGIADSLSKQLQRENRAYGKLIKASIVLVEGNPADAIDLLQSAIGNTDMWLARLELGKAYLQGGAFPEAMSEFETCQKRIGEATALYLDDIPTYHRSVELSYWLGRSQHELGITGAAGQNLQLFLDRKRLGSTSHMVVDAQQRLGTLTSAATTESEKKPGG